MGPDWTPISPSAGSLFHADTHPDYTEKLNHIRLILSKLRPDEAFFSIDEFGPFAVKMQPGRALTAPGEQRVVPQWQKSRGRMIITAALELSSNQVTHFIVQRRIRPR